MIRALVTPPPAPLRRQLGLWAVCALVVGDMLGTGIFFTPGELAAVAQSPWQVYFFWAVCGAITLCGALTLAELTTLLPRAGASYHIIREGFGPFWAFLKMFRAASVVTGRRVLAISDNAQYHRSKLDLQWRHQQAPQFGLDFLPPYSPELNPIERVWNLTRRLCLHNRYFGFLDGVVSAVEEQFAEWTEPNDTLRRLCAIT